MRPLPQVRDWFAGTHLSVLLYEENKGGLVRGGEVTDEQAREAILAAMGEEDEEYARRWDTATVTRGLHYRVVPCQSCDDDEFGPHSHIRRSQPGRGAFPATEVTRP